MFPTQVGIKLCPLSHALCTCEAHGPATVCSLQYLFMGVDFRHWASEFSGGTECVLYVCGSVRVWACERVCSVVSDRSQLGYCHRLAPQAGTVFLHASYCRGSTVVGQQWPKAPRPSQPTGTFVSVWRTDWTWRKTACWRAFTAAMSSSPSTTASPRKRRWGPGWDGEERLGKPAGEASSLWTRKHLDDIVIAVIFILFSVIRISHANSLHVSTESCCWMSDSLLWSSRDSLEH